MNLQAWLKQSHSLAEQLRVIEGVCAALNELHERGVVHGDLSPLTVDIGPDGQGALGSPELGGSLGLGAGRGSGPYIAPEVVQNAPASPKADIYAAGILFYEMLTGVVPLAGQAPPLRDKRTDVPRDLADAVTACLETDPNWRPKDLAYLLELVRKLRGSDSVAAAPRLAPVRAPEPRSGTTAPTPKVKPPPAPARSPGGGGGGVPLLPIAAVGVLIVGGGIWFAMQSQRPAQTPVAHTEPVPTAVPVTQPSPEPEPAATTAKPTPKPKPSGASPEPSAAPTPVPTPTPRTNPSPVVTPPPTTEPASTRPIPIITPTPVATPTPPPVTVGPPALKTVAPPSMKGPGTTILDVHGIGLHPSHKAQLLKGGKPATGIVVTRQRFVNDGLIQVVVKVSEASAGSYGLVMLDTEGRASNLVPFQITR